MRVFRSRGARIAIVAEDMKSLDAIDTLRLAQYVLNCCSSDYLNFLYFVLNPVPWGSYMRGSTILLKMFWDTGNISKLPKFVINLEHWMKRSFVDSSDFFSFVVWTNVGIFEMAVLSCFIWQPLCTVLYTAGCAMLRHVWLLKAVGLCKDIASYVVLVNYDI